MFYNVSFFLVFIFLSSSDSAPGNFIELEGFVLDLILGKEIVGHLEDVENMVDRFWGQDCMLDLQCAKVMVEDIEVQISVCDNRKEYEGKIILFWKTLY